MRIFVIVLSIVMLGVAGCTGMKMTNPYISTVDRTDQNIAEGNRGYLKGTPPPAPERGELKRALITVDVDLPPTTKERQEMEEIK